MKTEFIQPDNQNVKWEMPTNSSELPIALESHEMEEKPNIKEILSGRISQKEYQQVSSLARSFGPERSDEYRQSVKQAADFFLETLEIDESLFDDPAYQEPFIALCDSWAYYKLNGDFQNHEEQRQFLFEFARVLTADKSGFNQRAFADSIEGRDKYLFEVPALKEERKIEVENFRNFQDSELTNYVKQLCQETGEESLLSRSRGFFGITPKTEKPFDIIVLNQTCEPGSNTVSYDWETLQGINTAAITLKDEKGQYYFVLPSQVAKNLQSKDKDMRNSAMELINHEYGHTQRQLRLGVSTDLGRNFDERVISVAAEEEPGFFDTKIYEMVLFGSLTDEEQSNFNSKRESSYKSDNLQADFYKDTVDAYGPRVLLHMLASHPISYSHETGIEKIPGVRKGIQYRVCDLTDVLINDLEEIKPGSAERLTTYFENLDPKLAESFKQDCLSFLIYLPEFLEQIYYKKAA